MKLVLNSLPIYYLGLFPMPKMVAKRLFLCNQVFSSGDVVAVKVLHQENGAPLNYLNKLEDWEWETLSRKTW